jgi:hypothetical protein
MNSHNILTKRVGLLVAAAVMVGIVIFAGNLLGVVVGSVLNLPGGTDQYGFGGGTIAAATVATIWAAIAGYRFIARAVAPSGAPVSNVLPTGAIRRDERS